MPDYRLKYDFHTHTIFSHGKGTIEQNVMRAREIGLAAIAISDHVPGHMTYGIKRSDIGEPVQNFWEFAGDGPDSFLRTADYDMRLPGPF